MPELANSLKTRWKDRRVGSWQLLLSRETESAMSRSESANSATARVKRNDSSFEMSFRTPSSEMASFRRRTTLASERDCQRCRSFEIAFAISNDKTATRFGEEENDGFFVRLCDNVVLTLMSQVSSAMEKLGFGLMGLEEIEVGEMGRGYFLLGMWVWVGLRLS